MDGKLLTPQIFFSFIKTEKNFSCENRAKSRCKPGIRILFLKEYRHTRHSSRQYRRCADISARSYKRVWSKFLYYRKGLKDTFKKRKHSLKTFPWLGFDKFQLKAGLWDQRGLKSPLRADENELGFFVDFPERFCNIKRWNYMSACSSTGHDISHVSNAIFIGFSFNDTAKYLDIFSKIPTLNI